MSKKFNYQEEMHLLAENKCDVLEPIINKFAKSNLPNEFFLQQFDFPVKKPFCEKKYWRSFARVLVARDIINDKNTHKKIMIWLQDINWPGSEIIFDYITKNINVFYSTIKECVFEALKNEDEAWLSSLLAAIYQSKGLSDTEISFNLKKIQYYIEINDKDSLYNFIDNIFD